MCMVNHGLPQRGALSARVRTLRGFGAGREMWSVWPGPIRFSQEEMAECSLVRGQVPT